MDVVFTSDRLIFRKFSAADGLLIYELNSDPEVLKYLHEEPTTPERASSIVKDVILPQYKLYNHGRWAVHLKSGKEFIGWCGLKYRIEMDKVDVGYRFHRRFWGLGYATEAAKKSIDYGFRDLHLEEIFAAAHVDNIASIRVLEKIGMTFNGLKTIDGCPAKTFLIHNNF